MAKSWFLIIVFLGVAVTILVFSSKPREETEMVAPVPIVTPKPEQIMETRSGDGKMKLMAKVQELSDGNIQYNLEVLGETVSPRELLFVILDKEEVIELPFNSWSPDNKQLFIQKRSGQMTEYFVYKANGEKYGEDDYLDLMSYWTKSKIKYKVRDVTGWEGNDLLKVRTSKEDGSNGPSFWFVTGTRRFLQLR